MSQINAVNVQRRSTHTTSASTS